MGFKYFIKNIFQIAILLAAIGLTTTFSMEDGGLTGILLFIMLFANVVYIFPLGDGWFLKITGISTGGAFVGFLLGSMVLTWVEANKHIVIGVLLLAYTISQLIETIRFAREVKLFVTITGLICVVIPAIEAFLSFAQKSALIGGEGIGAVMLIIIVICTLINLIARTANAYYVYD